MKKTVIISLLLLFAGVLSAQTTKVKGRVTDKETGEGIPFAAVLFEGTLNGVSTDMEGYYSYETRNPGSDILVAQIIGYETQSFRIVKGSFSQVNFSLMPVKRELTASFVKADNRYIKWMLSKIDEHRDRNDPEKRPEYSCKLYTKLELDMVNPRNPINKALIPSKFDFIYEYMDTSVVSGLPYLPAMISESTVHRFHRKSPALDKEIIEASRISGFSRDNALQQFTGSLHLRNNFYDSHINIFDVNIPSPLMKGGLLYYNYYIIDSLQVDGRKTYKIRFHPKKMVSSATFDGELLLDSEDFALRSIRAKLQKDGTINWLRDLVIEAENRRLPDSTWFYERSKFYADFSVTLRDSSKMMAFLGNREMYYFEPEFNVTDWSKLDDNVDQVHVVKDAAAKDDSYWEQARPYNLTPKEQGIYNMVDSVQNVPLYKNMYNFFNMLATGYWDTKYIGLGPYHSVFTFNGYEGVRLQAGLRTTKEFSRKMRFTVFGAYGFRDKAAKYGGKAEFMFGTEPWRKLTLTAKKDVVQLGSGTSAIDYESNIFKSILRTGDTHKMSPITEFSVRYDHEFASGINASASLESMRIYDTWAVPFDTPDGGHLRSISSNQAHLQMRFSWKETWTRGVFAKQSMHTKFPVLTFDVVGALKGITRDDYSFLRTEFSLKYKMNLAPAGFSFIRMNAGHIMGKVPYPLLKLHEGNNSFFYDKNAFACMDYYEFASDTWASLIWEHNFNGFFLGKIPLLRKLQWREVVVLRTAWGTLSKANDGTRSLGSESQATLLFPEGMTSLKTPYIETGVGITNILRLLRVDIAWRLTHVKRSPFAVTFGLDVRF